MSARNENYPWLSHYGHYNFFEEKMRQHGIVVSLTTEAQGIYELTRKQGSTIRIFICECYAFGVAEYVETINKLGPVDAVIINSSWCGYSHDAKRHCRNNRVGLFTIGEFMGALRHNNFWSYLTDSQKEYFKEQGWL